MRRVDLVGAAGVAALSLPPLAAQASEAGKGIDVLAAMALPAGLSVAAAAAFYLAARALYRGAPAATLAAAMAVLVVFWPGWIASLGSRLADAPYDSWTAPTLIALGTLGIAAWGLIPRIGVPEGLPRGVLTFGTILLGLQLLGFRDKPVGASILAPPELDRPAARPPDVYFLVLDQYTGRTALDRHYGLDITPFEGELRDRGFVVPATSRANYAFTIVSLASMLNWTYLDGLAGVDPDSRNHSAIVPLIEANRTFATFQRLGYEVHFFPTPYHATRRNRIADVEWRPPDRQPGEEFRVRWVLATAFGVGLQWYCRARECGGPEAATFPYPVESAEEQRWKFDLLPQLQSRDGRPLFVFAHVLLPHAPYVVDADCASIDPIWPDSEDDPRTTTLYPEQIVCLNRMVLELIDALLDRPDGPPAIVLQSDHGHGRIVVDRRRGAVRSREEAGPERVAERFDIFAAYRVPGLPAALAADTVTPVNVVPLVLNALFDAGIPLQERKGYWSVPRRPYVFERQF